VYAFEPQAYAAEVSDRNARLNGFAHVSVKQMAISNANGTATLDVSSGPVSASILKNMGGSRTISVPTLSLTSFAERVDLQRLDFIKMDIEGTEYDAQSVPVQSSRNLGQQSSLRRRQRIFAYLLKSVGLPSSNCSRVVATPCTASMTQDGLREWIS
jgi:Methyltransferase FkbM domain